MFFVTSALIDGITDTSIAGPSSSSTGSGLIEDQITLDSNGQGSLSVANANTKEVYSLVFDTAQSDQSQPERYDRNNSTLIKIQGQSATNANANQVVNIIYK